MAGDDGDRKIPHRRVPSTVEREQATGIPSDAGPHEAAKKKGGAAQTLAVVIPAVLGFIAAVLLGLWLMSDRQPVDVEPRVPIEHKPAARAEQAQQQAEAAAEDAAAQQSAAGSPQEQVSGPAARMESGQGSGQGTAQPRQGSSAGSGASTSGSWPCFRGDGRDAIAQEASGLARSWPAGGPPKLWSVKMLGPGHAGAAIRNGRVYVLDYDIRQRADVLRCLSLADGSEIWRHSYPVLIKDNHGISRTVPAVTDQYVVALGPMGHVTCVRTDNGERVWQIDLCAQYNTKIPSWYAGQCPLVDGNRAIIAPGGKALMIAVDLASGQVAWQTPNPNGWQMTHASIIPAQVGGRTIYTYPASGGVIGVSPSDGTLLWQYPDWTVRTANVPSPVPVGDGRLLITGGYGAGSMLLDVSGESPREVWRIPQATFGSHQHTPIFYQNHLFGVSMDEQLVCLDLQGKRVWSSGHTKRFGIGPYIIADGMIYVLADDGTLVLAEASTSGYRELARAKVLPGPDAWAPIALAGTRLVLRDRDTMVCLDVGG